MKRQAEHYKPSGRAAYLWGLNALSVGPTDKTEHLPIGTTGRRYCSSQRQSKVREWGLKGIGVGLPVPRGGHWLEGGCGLRAKGKKRFNREKKEDALASRRGSYDDQEGKNGDRPLWKTTSGSSIGDRGDTPSR